MRRMARRRKQKIGSKAAGPSNGVEQLLLQGPSKGLAVSSKGVEQLLLLGPSKGLAVPSKGVAQLPLLDTFSAET